MDVFDGALAAPSERDAKRIELFWRPADTDTERQPPTAQSIETCLAMST